MTTAQRLDYVILGTGGLSLVSNGYALTRSVPGIPDGPLWEPVVATFQVASVALMLVLCRRAWRGIQVRRWTRRMGLQVRRAGGAVSRTWRPSWPR